MREKSKRWRKKLKSEIEKQKSGLKNQKVNDMGGKERENRCNILSKIEKVTVRDMRYNQYRKIYV